MGETQERNERNALHGGGNGRDTSGLLAALKTLWIRVLNPSVFTPVRADARSPEQQLLAEHNSPALFTLPGPSGRFGVSV